MWSGPTSTRFARAVVFSYDEKTQCQALDRTQPSLPMKPGRAGTMTHDYKRNGTIDLFAAMNIATGEVLMQCQKRHAAADVLRFFKQIDASVPRGLAVHVILDNLSAHKTPEIQKWLAHRDRRRWHLHFTPTSSSWCNLVERWFKELTDKRLDPGRFTRRRQPHRRDHHLGRALERRPQALRLESDRRADHREGPPRAGRTVPDQFAGTPLGTACQHRCTCSAARPVPADLTVRHLYLHGPAGCRRARCPRLKRIPATMLENSVQRRRRTVTPHRS